MGLEVSVLYVDTGSGLNVVEAVSSIRGAGLSRIRQYMTYMGLRRL